VALALAVLWFFGDARAQEVGLERARRIYEAGGDPAPALDAAIAADPGLAEAHLLRAQVTADRTGFAAAAADFEAALRLAPGDKTVWRGMGEALADAGETARGEAALAMALALDAGDAQSWAELGRLERKIGRRAAALTFLERGAAHHDLAEIFLEDGDDARAERELAADLDAEPTCRDSRLNLAALALAHGDPARAAAEYQRSLGYHPDDIQALAGLGHARLALGDDERAVGALLGALDAGSDDQAVARDLSAARLRQRWRHAWPFAVLSSVVAVGLAAALLSVRKPKTR